MLQIIVLPRDKYSNIVWYVLHLTRLVIFRHSVVIVTRWLSHMPIVWPVVVTLCWIQMTVQVVICMFVISTAQNTGVACP